MVNTQNLKLVAIGNPLLDMQIRNGEEVLQKYGLKANDAVLASPEQQSIYKYIVDNYEVTYIAGGAAQNTARAAQYVLPEGSTAYIGCVGNDDLAQQLRNANDREGLQSVYQVTDAAATGSCAVVITGHDRSLCTNLGAAEKFDKRHLDSPDAKAAIDAAHDRLRPIVMTSLAFSLGVVPLAIATGPSAASQNAIGTAVIGGMVAATVLAVFFVPVFFVVIMALFERRKKVPATV